MTVTCSFFSMQTIYIKKCLLTNKKIASKMFARTLKVIAREAKG